MKDEGFSDPIDRIAEINIHEFMVSLGMLHFEMTRKVLERLLSPLARRFAEYAFQFDREVGAIGLQQAAQHAIRKYVRCLEVCGNENIPKTGPVLILSNHPGMADSLALTASIPRPDLRIIVQERAVFHLLPALTQQIIYIPDQIEDRLASIREAIHHLLNGGAMLTFPAGRIEPDPAVMAGACDSLTQWSQSIVLFARRIPEMTVIPTVVSGVVSKTAMTHPLTRLRRLRRDRERLGYTLQLLANVLSPSMWPVDAHLEFIQPVPAQALLQTGSQEHSMEMLLARVREVMSGYRSGL